MEGTIREGSIVVGLDGSGASLAALDWATAQAQLTRSPIHLVTAFSPDRAEVMWGIGATYESLHHAGEQILARGRNRVQLHDRMIQISTSHPEGYPAAALIRASVGARLLVLGSHGDSVLHVTTLGATAHQVAGHAACPLAIVRSDHAADPGFARVTVGVDLAEGMPALEWAFSQADLLGAELRVVHAWQPRDARDPGLHGGADWTDYAERCTQEITAAIVKHQEHHPDVKVHAEILKAHPAKALIEESHSSDVIVVGARGAGGFPRLVLGQTAQTLLHHSGCPVVVVR